MADGPGQEVQGIALGLTLDTTGWSAGIQRAKAELAGLTAGAKDIRVSTGVRGGGGVSRETVSPTVSPGFQVSRGAVRDLRVDINQHLRTMAGQGEAVQVPVTLSRVNFGALRTQIQQGIGEVPIKVRIDPTSLKGQASLIAAIMSTSTGASMGKASAVIESAAASRAQPIPKRAMGGPVRGYASGGPTYAQWAQARHQSMGGAGKVKITPAEEATAQRGIQNVKHLIALSQRNDPALGAAGRNWYTEQAQIHDFAGRAKTLGVSLKQLVDTIAILSSGAQWYANKADAFTAAGVRRPTPGPNITAAESLIKHVTKGSPVASSAVVTGEMINDVKRYFGGAEMNAANFGPKRSQFAEAFRNPMAFPIDRWQGRATTLGERHGVQYGADMTAGPVLERMMAQAVKGRDWTSADAPGPAHRRASVYAVEQAAAQLGIEPRGVQAESWTEIKRLEGVGNKLFRLDKKSGLALPRAHGGPVFRPVDAETFHSTISAASQITRPSGRRVGETVYTYPQDEYAHMRTYLNQPKTAGYAIKPDGDLVSVFNVGGPGAGKSAMRSAIQRGATKLDAFDEVGSALAIGKVHPNDKQKNLPNFYKRFGFREQYRDHWNPDYAPPGWQGGTPDVVYMQRKPREHRYRGGPTLAETFPNAYINLKHYERPQRLAVGKELLKLGYAYPHVAEKTAMIEAAKPDYFERAYGAGAGKDIGGETTHLKIPGFDDQPRMRFNAGMSNADIAGLGGFSKKVTDMVAHEFGHGIDVAFGQMSQNNPALMRFKPASEYGYTNEEEHFAELFLQHWRNKGAATHPGASSMFNDLSFQSFKRSGAYASTLGRKATGGEVIAGELGRELFVPTSMAGIIPPDVMGQIPHHAMGGPVEIPPGPLVWQPPSDGWIIPNHLMNKVPRYAAGGNYGPGIEYDPGEVPGLASNRQRHDEERRARRRAADAARRANRQAAATALGRDARDRSLDARELERHRVLSVLSTAKGMTEGLDTLPQGGGDLDEWLRSREAGVSRSAARGLTGRSSLGGIFSFLLGGGKQRKLAQLEASGYERQYREFLPPGERRGTDPIQLFTDRVADAEKAIKLLTPELDKYAKGTSERTLIDTQLERAQKRRVQNEEALNTAHELQIRHANALANSEGGLVRNFAATTLAGVAFTFGTQAIDTAVGLLAQSAAPELDRLSGFGPTSQRVTQGLGQQLPQAGTTSTLFGQTGIGAGLSAGVTDYLQSVLGPSVYAKAGGNAAGTAGDLLRAAIGAQNGAPTGLLGGYGGIGGGSAFAEQLGGGKGFAETIASQFADATGQSPNRPGAAGFFGQQLDNLGKGVSLFADAANAFISGDNSALKQKYVSGSGLLPTQVVKVDPKNVGVVADVFNQAAQRAAQKEGQGATQLKSVSDIVGTGPGALNRANDLVKAYGQLDDNTKGILDAGYAFVDASGKILKTQDQVNKAYAQSAEGFTLPDPEVFAKASAQALQGSEQSLGLRGGIERDTLIPGQLGQQLAASPQLAATAGIAKGFKSTIADLGQTQTLQDSVQKDAEAGLAAQKQLILENLGLVKSTQFGSYMDEVKDYGTQIAGLQTTLANKQAAVGAMSYANSLRLINRSIADAKGLVTGQGSSLGAIERKQYEVGRESQSLQFELQQRQINFQTAVAGFQAPGITGQERAARMAEAKLEASYAQRQLNLGRQGFGLEGQAFNTQAQRGVTDLEHQKSLLTAQYGLEQEQLAVQKRIAALTVKQAQSQQKALSIFNEATGTFDGRLGVASAYVAQFGGTLAAAMKAVRIALGLPAESPGTSSQNDKNRPKSSDKGHAAGIMGYTTGATDMLVGEANTETVAVLRNPRKVSTGAYAPAGGGGGWGGGNAAPVIQISITGNTFGESMSPDSLARELADQIEARLGMKARLLGRQ